MSNDPRIIREGGYQGTRDPGQPPDALFGQQINPYGVQQQPGNPMVPGQPPGLHSQLPQTTPHVPH
jgi:hypothetical protein